MIEYAPDVNNEDILTWEATGFRDNVSKEDFPGVLMAYDKAITTTFYLAMGSGGYGDCGKLCVTLEECKKPKVVEPKV
jgi:hypothetical protein